MKDSQQPFALQAARFSFLAPIVAFFLNVTTRSVTVDSSTAKIVIGAICCLLILAGFLLSLYALFFRKKETKGILGYALAGLVLNGLIVISAISLLSSISKSQFNASLEVSKIAAQCPVNIDENSQITSVRLNNGKEVIVEYTLHNHLASSIDLEKWEQFTSPRIKAGIDETVFYRFLTHGFRVRYRYVGKNGGIIIEYEFDPREYEKQ